MRMRTKVAIVAVCLIAATSCFSKNKPDPERICSCAGAMVTCPQTIKVLQNNAECVLGGNKLRLIDGTEIKSGNKTSISKVKVDIFKPNDGIFEVELTDSDETKGKVRVPICRRLFID